MSSAAPSEDEDENAAQGDESDAPDLSVSGDALESPKGSRDVTDVRGGRRAPPRPRDTFALGKKRGQERRGDAHTTRTVVPRSLPRTSI